VPKTLSSSSGSGSAHGQGEVGPSGRPRAASRSTTKHRSRTGSNTQRTERSGSVSSASKITSRHRQDKSVDGDSTSSVDIAAAKDTKHIRCGSDRELAKEMDNIHRVLSDMGDWNQRKEALKRFQGLVLGCSGMDQFVPQALRLRDALTAQVQDLRSAIVREVCAVLFLLAQATGIEFEPVAIAVLPVLFKCTFVTIAVIAESGYQCIRSIIRECPTPRVLGALVEQFGSKNGTLRWRCAQALLLALRSWPVCVLERHLDALECTIRVSLEDAGPDVRATGRELFWSFRRAFPERGSRLHARLDGQKQKLLDSERPPLPESARADSKARQAGCSESRGFDRRKVVAGMTSSSPRRCATGGSVVGDLDQSRSCTLSPAVSLAIEDVLRASHEGSPVFVLTAPGVESLSGNSAEFADSPPQLLPNVGHGLLPCESPSRKSRSASKLSSRPDRRTSTPSGSPGAAWTARTGRVAGPQRAASARASTSDSRTVSPGPCVKADVQIQTKAWTQAQAAPPSPPAPLSPHAHASTPSTSASAPWTSSSTPLGSCSLAGSSSLPTQIPTPAISVSASFPRRKLQSSAQDEASAVATVTSPVPRNRGTQSARTNSDEVRKEYFEESRALLVRNVSCTTGAARASAMADLATLILQYGETGPDTGTAWEEETLNAVLQGLSDEQTVTEASVTLADGVREPVQRHGLAAILAGPSSKKATLRALATAAGSETAQAWEKYFGRVLCLALEALPDLDTRVDQCAEREAALLCIQELVAHQPCFFDEFAEVVAAKLFEAYHVTRDMQTISSIDLALDRLMGAIDPTRALEILLPVLASERVPLQAMTRLLSPVMQRMHPKRLREHLEVVLPGLIAAFSSQSSEVRKAAVEALVDLHMMLGEEVVPHLVNELTPHQMKLFSNYINSQERDHCHF